MKLKGKRESRDKMRGAIKLLSEANQEFRDSEISEVIKQLVHIDERLTYEIETFEGNLEGIRSFIAGQPTLDKTVEYTTIVIETLEEMKKNAMALAKEKK